MKNILFILAMSWLLIACNNQQDEKYRNDEQEKDTFIKTRGINDTIVFPYTDHHISPREENVYLSISEPSENILKEMCSKYPQISSYPPRWTDLYIQYKIEGYHPDRGWYYYNPDTILSKTPCKIPLIRDPTTNTVILKASKLPSRSFKHRVQLIGRNLNYYMDYINYITAPQEQGVYSFETESWNFMGFKEEGDPLTGNETYIDIDIRLTFDVELHLDARGREGFTHVLKFDNQTSPEFSVSFNQVRTFYHSFTKYDRLYKVPLNTIQVYAVQFEGSKHYVSFYLDPDHLTRVYEINDFKDIYISAGDRTSYKSNIDTN